MQKNAKILLGLGIAVGIIGTGILVGWWGSRGKVAMPTRPLEAPPMAPTASSPATPQPSAVVPQPAVKPSAPVVAAATTPDSVSTNQIPDWEDKVDEILGSDDEDTNKVKQLFQMFPRLPEDGQEEVAQHLSNLVPDDNYSPLGQLLQNTNLSESVLDVLMSDVLNRPNSVKLPELLQVAQNPAHPKADEAKDLVELYLDEDDPAKWSDKMQEWLKENPD